MRFPYVTSFLSTHAAALRACKLVVLIVWVLTSSGASVRAETCGHYLFRNGLPVGSSPIQMSGNPVDSLDTSVPSAPSRSPWIPAPCNGPGCRQNSIPLSAPPATPVASVASEFAAILQLLVLRDGSAGAHLLPVSEDGHLFQSQPVFRPPVCANC